MNNLFVRLTVCIASAAFLNTVHAQWSPVGGPRGGEIYLLAANGDTVIARSECRPVYISTDNGESWNVMESELPDGGCPTSFAIGVGDIFAGRSMGGMYRTDDKGKSWTPIMSGLPDTAIYSIATNDSTVFIGTGSGVFRSIDNGSTWNASDSGMPDNPNMVASCLAANGSTVFAGTQSGYFRSTDNGVSWSAISFPNNFSISNFSVNGSMIFARTYWGIYRSTDNGASWTSVNSGLEDSAGLKYLAMSGTAVFVGSPLKFYRSTDNGESWDSISRSFTNNDPSALAANHTAVFLGTKGGTIYRSTDNGGTWTAADSGLTYLSIPSMVAIGGTIFAGSSGGVYRHTADTAGWMPMIFNISREYFYLSNPVWLATNGNTLFAGTAAGLLSSTDNGTTWTMGEQHIGITALAVSGANCIAGMIASKDLGFGLYSYSGTLYLTQNSGLNWEKVLSDFSANQIQLVARGNEIIAVGTRNWVLNDGTPIRGSSIYVSIDTGATWELSGSNSMPILSCAISDSTLIAGTQLPKGTNPNSSQYPVVILSTDKGATWSHADSGLPDSVNVASLIVHGRSVFAGTSAGIFLTTDKGASWQSAGTGFPDDEIALSFGICGSYLFAGTNHSGIWRMTIPEKAGIRNNTPHPDHLRLYAFNLGSSARSRNSVIIDFTIPSSERVTVTLYNLSGAEIATIIDSNPEHGAHRLYWDTRPIPTGCYLLRLQAGSAAFMKSIVVFR